MTQPISLAIVGWRHYHDYESFEKCVDEWVAVNGQPARIVTGGDRLKAQGADRMAVRYAEEHKLELVVHNPDWGRYPKKAAGPIRNAKIVADCTHMLAFPHPRGAGTQDSIRQARRANRPLTIHNLAGG